ncbi:fasciclin domain-containing protein [Variovorax sp. J22R133]|uniref:fasciclin domain-containing protein n=1 Tax=Variovorax brevis TaxID=3053503 RepID=UPI002578EFFA|nr:fasciclin domain-containing protein [Variovorax sp. J22R133]MDM0114781.1 fasciclin domain-containing protein [Variovorax sp. J22R133]
MLNMSNRRQLITFGAAALGGALLLPGCGGGSSDKTVGTQLNERKNIMNQAESKPELSVFVEAVDACGLRSTLEASGTNTAFAPTNDAFTALLGEMGKSKDQLFADKATLTVILKFHILGKAQFTEAIVEGHAIEPIGGGFFKIDKENNVFKATDGRNRVCTLLSTDIVALNGVLHTLDRVMLPADKDIVVTCQTTPQVSMCVQAIDACGLTDTLKQPGPYTFFCPTDAAFTAVLVELNITFQAFLADTAQCRRVMSCHMVPSRKFKKEFVTDAPVTTVEGTTIKVNASFQVIDSRGRVCNLTRADVLNTNGVVHVCDKVILPPA